MSRNLSGILKFSVAALALVAAASVVSAASITIDENGHGTVGTTALTAALGTDPNPAHVPGQTNVLVYSGLPFAGTAGDVEVFVGPTPGDVIRFNGNNTIIFYAAPGVDGNGNSMATQFTPPIPPFPVPNTVQLTYAGSNLTYTPTSGQPGFDTSSPSYTFVFGTTTTATPEPASVALLVLGGGLLFGVRKFRQS